MVPKLKISITHVDSISTSARSKKTKFVKIQKRYSQEFRNQVDSNKRRYKIIQNISHNVNNTSQESNYK